MEVLGSKGVNMVPFGLNYTVDLVQGILNFTMDVDMLAHFDEWQRTGQDDLYEAQDQWPVELRRARVITAVDYIQVFPFSFWFMGWFCDGSFWFIYFFVLPVQAQRARG